MPYFMKLSNEYIVNKLKLTFNESFMEGTFPSKMKLGVTHPIHKGESKMICSKYRSISI